MAKHRYLVSTFVTQGLALLLFMLGWTLAAQQVAAQTYELGGDEYRVEDGKWYVFSSDGKRGNAVLPQRLAVRLQNRGAVTAFDFSQLGVDRTAVFVESKPLFGDYYVVHVNDVDTAFNLASALRLNPQVDYVSFDVLGTVFEDPREPSDPKYQDGSQWNLDKINMLDAWLLSRGVNTIVVAVTDTGIDDDHTDLDANIWYNQAELNGQTGVDDDGNGFVDDVSGWDSSACADPNDDCSQVGDNDPSPLSGDHHGTSSAGIIAAETNNGEDIAGIAGGWGTTGPGVKLMNVRVGDSNTDISAIALSRGIQYAAENGADVINVSIGLKGPEHENPGNTANLAHLEAAVDEATSIHDCVIVAASGNEGDLMNKRLLQYPAIYPEVIGVGATLQDDARWEKSNIGGDEAEPQLDVMAPGGVATIPTLAEGGGTRNFSGTSASAPHVAGVAALMRSVYPDIPWSTVRTLIRNTANPAGCIEIDPNLTYEQECGQGRVDAYEAVYAAIEANPNAQLLTTNTIFDNQTFLGQDIYVLPGMTLTLEGTVTLDKDPATGEPSDLFLLGTLAGPETATLNLFGGSELFLRPGSTDNFLGDRVIDELNSCILAEQSSTVRFGTDATTIVANEAFLVNAQSVFVLENGALVTYESTAKPLLVEPGAAFHLVGSAALQLQRSVHLLGEAANPIRFTQGGTVHVAGNDAASSFEHVSFETTDVLVENGTSATFTESAFTNAALTISTGADVTMTDGAEIRLGPGFHAQPGSHFHAYIDASAAQARLAEAPPAPRPTVEQPPVRQAEPASEPASALSVADEPHRDLTLVETAAEALPTAFSLSANYPNPFNPTTTITYALKEDIQVTLTDYNVLGQHVATLVDGFERAGYKSVVWDGRDAGGIAVPSGAYVYRLEAGDFTEARTMLLLK